MLAAGAGAFGIGGSASPGAKRLGPRDLTQSRTLIEAAKAEGQSCQTFVALGGRTLLDEGIGPQIAPESLVAWASACKPTTVAAVMRLIEAGRIGLDQKVASSIPEFAANGKEAVSLRHLMTHTEALGGHLGPTTRESFAETIARISAAPRGSPRDARARIAARHGEDGARAALPGQRLPTQSMNLWW